MNEEPLSFDLDAYAARYYGRGKIQRLLFIADKSPNLRNDALRLAITEAKKGRDTVLYKEILSHTDGSLGPSFDLDTSWIRENDVWASRELEKLRHELEDNKQQANKEVIRTGHNDLGDFFHKRGKLQQARGDYIKTRDYCTQAKHNLQMCMKVITVSIEADDFLHVENHYLMAENTPEVDKYSFELSKMRACAGLAFMVRGNFGQAAQRFCETNRDANEDRIAALGKEFGDIMSLEDVATYGGLCALASFDRDTLMESVVKKLEFRGLLELVPDIREMVIDFHNTRYTRCLATMERIRPELMLDMYLGSSNHVEELYVLIRRKAIVQYVAPYVSTDLAGMQRVFNTTAEALEEELLSLIEGGEINCRIDTQNRALHDKRTNQRLTALLKSLERGQEAFNEAEAMLLRMTMLKNNMQVSPNAAGGHALGQRSGSISSVVDNVFERGFRS